MTSRGAILALGMVFTLVFFIDFCGLVYGCGCRSLWNGADEHCNVHVPQAKHCPWCTIGLLGDLFILCWIWSVQAFCALCLSRISWSLRLLLTLLAFPVAAFIAALMLGYKAQYWN